MIGQNVALNLIFSSLLDSQDYISLSSEVLTFNGDVSRVCRDISIVDDDLVEGTEEFNVRITESDPQIDLDRTLATVEIADNDRKEFIHPHIRW